MLHSSIQACNPGGHVPEEDAPEEDAPGEDAPGEHESRVDQNVKIVKETRFMMKFNSFFYTTHKQRQCKYIFEEDKRFIRQPTLYMHLVFSNIVHEEHWESKSYPCLFPDGKKYFHDKRDVNTV